MEKSYSKILFAVLLIFVIAGTGQIMAQTRIAGVVTDENNNPVEQVKISCPEMPDTVQTNAMGEYFIGVPDGCRELHFIFNEQKVKEKIGNRTVINVRLSADERDSINRDYRFNVMLNCGGAVVWGSISGSVLVTDFMSLDVGLGLGKIYGGTTLYFPPPFKNSNWQPYVGLNIAYFEEFMGPTSTLIYLPAGMRYLNKKGTSFSFEAGYLGSDNDQFLLDSPIWGGIRFGKYF